jgi:hypothetical protein
MRMICFLILYDIFISIVRRRTIAMIIEWNVVFISIVSRRTIGMRMDISLTLYIICIPIFRRRTIEMRMECCFHLNRQPADDRYENGLSL